MADANITNNTTLPAEVLVKIFRHCDLDEIVNIVDVCQLWRDVVIHQHMSLNDIVLRQAKDIDKLINLLCKPVRFVKLHVMWQVPLGVDCRHVSLDALTNATSLIRLQSFTFKVNEPSQDLGKRRILEDNCRILDALLELLLRTNADTLTHLTLGLLNSRCIFTTGMKLVELLEACQHLTHLVLRGCCLGKVAQQRCADIIPTLTHLELLDLEDLPEDTYETSPNNLSFIAAVKRGCPNISKIMIYELDAKPSDDVSLLQFVTITDMLNLEGFDTDQWTSLVSWLDECDIQLTVNGLAPLDKYVTDDILLSMVQHLVSQKDVFVTHCQRITNQGMANVITSSPELTTIGIEGIKNIDTGILHLLNDVVTKQDVYIEAFDTKLSRQMGSRGDYVYTGKNKNICFAI